MTAALALLLAMAQVPQLDADAVASWALSPCGKVVIHSDGADALAKAVRYALAQSARCERVAPSADAWTPGWTLEQELLMREHLGADSQLVIARPSGLSWLDGHGVVFAEVPYEAGKPLAASPRAEKAVERPTRFEASFSPAGLGLNPQFTRHFFLTVVHDAAVVVPRLRRAGARHVPRRGGRAGARPDRDAADGARCVGASRR